MHPAETSAREKIRRAEAHLTDLHGLVSAYTDSHPYRVLIDPPGDRGVPVGDGHRVLVWHEPPPLRLSTVTGDVVNNLRAALDHLVWGLADPKKRGGHTAFPIHTDDSARSREKFARRLDSVHQSAVAAIERMQPYNSPGEARDQPLAILNSLVNEDKHRGLLTVKLAVPVREFFGAFEITPLTEDATLLKKEPRFPELLRRFQEQDAGPNSRGTVVLVDPVANNWHMEMGMEAPAVQVVMNSPPHREVLDALHEQRIVVFQALDKLVGYLGAFETPVLDKIKLTADWD